MATTTAQSIQGFYQNILRRIGPPADVAFWTGVVDVQGVPLSQVENDFVTSPEAMAFVSPIVEIYQTYLGRAPDSAGFNAWVNALHGGMSLSAVENDFANSAESQAFYGGSISTPADSAFVTKLYQTVLNRAPTPAEVTAILGVTTNRATLLTDFLQSPEAGVTLTNASNQFLTSIGSGNTDPYGVSLFSGGSTVSNVFTLTPGADIIPNGLVGSNGTTSNDGNIVINGLVDSTTPANTTLNAADQLAGGNGANTLNVTYAGPAFVPDATNGALISEVQTFNARNTDPAAFVILDATNVPGLTAFNSNLGTGDVEVDNLAAGASAGIIGNGTLVNGELDANYVAAATAATINFSGGTGNAGPPAAGPNVFVTGAGVTSTTVNSTGGANTIAELDLSGTATTTLTVKAATNLKATVGVDSPALTSITASGAATSVSLGSLAGDPVTTIDASGLTAGGISVKAVGPALTKFTGGVGNDSLLLDTGVIQASPALDGGTGTNVLGIGDTGDLSLTPAIYTGINAAMNFETLELTGDGVTVHSSLLNPASSTLPTSPYTKIALNWAGALPDTIKNLDTTRSLSIINAANGGVFVDAALGSPALTLSLDGSSTTPAAVGGVGLNTAGSTSIGLASNGTATVADNSINLLTTEFNATVTVSGKQNLDIGGLQLGPGGAGADKGVLNASAFTGKLDVVADAGGGNTQTISVGSGGSVIGLTAADVAAILNLGTGTDQIQFLAGNASGIAGGTDVATANSFTAGAGGDDLDNVSGGSNIFTALTAAQQTAITGAATLGAAMDLAAADVPGGWTAFTFGADTFAQNTTAAAPYGGTDNIIDLKSTSVAALTQSNFG